MIADQVRQAPTARGRGAATVTVTRILSNGCRFVRCDRCVRGLVESAACFQVEIGRTAWICCFPCHLRNQRERVYVRASVAAVTLSALDFILARRRADDSYRDQIAALSLMSSPQSEGAGTDRSTLRQLAHGMTRQPASAFAWQTDPDWLAWIASQRFADDAERKSVRAAGEDRERTAPPAVRAKWNR